MLFTHDFDQVIYRAGLATAGRGYKGRAEFVMRAPVRRVYTIFATLGGMTAAEIAHVLGCKESTVKNYRGDAGTLERQVGRQLYDDHLRLRLHARVLYEELAHIDETYYPSAPEDDRYVPMWERNTVQGREVAQRRAAYQALHG